MLAPATMNQIKATTHAIVVHGVEDAFAAVAAARPLDAPLTLISAPGAAAYAGPVWFLEIVAQARATAPELAVSGMLDCADDAGHALAALRAGVEAIVFTGDAAIAEKLTAIARATGATVRDTRPPALDPAGGPQQEAACRAWLSQS